MVELLPVTLEVKFHLNLHKMLSFGTMVKPLGSKCKVRILVLEKFNPRDFLTNAQQEILMAKLKLLQRAFLKSPNYV